MSVHPFLYPLGKAERWMSFLGSCLDLSKTDLIKAEVLLGKNLVPVIQGPEIGNYLGISPKLVSTMVIRTPRYYREFKIRKPSGGFREISAPRVFLKTVQRYVLDCMLTPVVPHEAATGFRRDIGIRDGAKRHVGGRFLWNIDLKDFFPSIDQRRVTNLFSRLGFPNQASYFLSGLCCLQGKLPQGAPSSPAIANLIFFPTDTKITTLAQKHHIKYTRYADDLTFSSTRIISKEFRNEVGALIESAGFRVNKKSRD